MNDEPKRWVDDDHPLATLLEQAREQDAPSPETIARVSGAAAASAGGLPWPWIVLTGFVLAVGIIAWLWAPSAQPTAPSAHPAPPAVERPAAPQASLDPPSLSPAPTVDEALEPTAPSSRTTPPNPARPPASRPPEHALIREARAALPHSPRRALIRIRTHRRLYPNGRLTEEREALVVQVEVALGHRARAAQRLQYFESRYPGSAHTERLRRQLDALNGEAERP